MRLGRRTWWIAYAIGSLVIAGALAWVTAVVVQLERAELKVRTDAAQQDAVRLALWRMDSWLGPRIAQESARPYFEYLPYYPQERSYTKLLNAIAPGDVLTASPLLAYR
ncbi:MAG TPA: hypothetical protein VG711_00480, partial [Phycisphaerales bacterium]|nr:hypothetical protein [Phycisphaerales bacterium]